MDVTYEKNSNSTGDPKSGAGAASVSPGRNDPGSLQKRNINSYNSISNPSQTFTEYIRDKPQTGGKKRCWCGSGKAFEDCHGEHLRVDINPGTVAKEYVFEDIITPKDLDRYGDTPAHVKPYRKVDAGEKGSPDKKNGGANKKVEMEKEEDLGSLRRIGAGGIHLFPAGEDELVDVTEAMDHYDFRHEDEDQEGEDPEAD